MFCGIKPALAYAKKSGFPLVVKPRNSSLSKHIVCNIQNEADLKKAIKIAQIISRYFIVEKFIEGDVYRATLVNHKMAACCMREAPNVVGDGINTIAELIKIKNEHPWRGEAHQKNFTLHKISAGENARSFLTKQGLDMESVLPKGTKARLHNKIILKCGADIHDKTDEIHPDNVALFQKFPAFATLRLSAWTLSARTSPCRITGKNAPSWKPTPYPTLICTIIPHRPTPRCRRFDCGLYAG